MHRFIVTFAVGNDVDGIKALRALLKSALRRFGLRAVDVRELTDEPQQIRDQSDDVRER